jgi:NADH:ubiquinone reductase (H+-translocating)
MKNIVILGGGYAGIFAAVNLINKHGDVKIIIIDKNPYHQLLQQIHLIAANIKILEYLTLKINDLLKNDADFFEDSLESINLDKRRVITKTGIEYSYNYIIIALGATDAYYNVKGAQQYSHSFRSVSDALKLREAITKLPSDSVIVICGGGATGISLAGALSETFGEKIKIKVVDAQDNILAEWDPRLVKTAKKISSERNVEILTGQPVKEIGNSSVVVGSNIRVNCDLTVWTAGIKGFDIKTTPHIKTTKSERIIVNKYSQIEGFDNAFAVGDISAFTLENGVLSPQLAQFAVRQARNVTKNIMRKEGGEPMIELDYSQKGQILSLGRRCIGLINGILVTGALCEYAEDFVIDNYIAAIENRGKGIPALAYEDDVVSQISTSLNFMTYAASRVLSKQVKRDERRSSIR